MPIIPGETSQPTKDDPEYKLKDIHRFYEDSSTPIPYFFLSPGSYQVLKTLQFALKDKEWDPQSLIAHIAYLHQLNTESKIPDDQTLEAYANELRLALDKINDYEATIEISSGDMLDDLPMIDFQQALASSEQELEEILQGLEESELILHLDERDTVAIQEELVPAIEKERFSIDPATFMRGKTMQSFGLDQISDEQVYQVTIINQSLELIPDTEDENYARLACERAEIINKLNHIVNTERTKLMYQWIKLNRLQAQINLSETEFMFNESAQFDPADQASQENALVRQLAELELLSR